MNKAFEQIALLPGVSAAAFVGDQGELKGWCANIAIAPENLGFVAETCRGLLAALGGEQLPATLGAASFGARTLIFRRGDPAGLFMAYLDSPTDEKVISWLFERIEPLLADEGIRLQSVA